MRYIFIYCVLGDFWILEHHCQIWTGILSTRWKSAAEAPPHTCFYTVTSHQRTLCRKLRGWSKNCHGRCYELGMLPLCMCFCCAWATRPSTGRRKNVPSASVQALQLIAPAFCIYQFQWNSIRSFYNLICWHRFLQGSLLRLDSRLHIHFWELGGAADETLH